MESKDFKPTEEKVERNRHGTIIDRNMKDHGNDPFFVKKRQEDKAFLIKHGLPKDMEEKYGHPKDWKWKV